MPISCIKGSRTLLMTEAQVYRAAEHLAARRSLRAASLERLR